MHVVCQCSLHCLAHFYAELLQHCTLSACLCTRYTSCTSYVQQVSTSQHISSLDFDKHTFSPYCGCMQSLFISILSGAGVIKTTEDSKNLQNFLIACEMLPASIFMLWAFPYTDYKTSGGTQCFSLCLQACCIGKWPSVQTAFGPWDRELVEFIPLHAHCVLASFCLHQILRPFWAPCSFLMMALQSRCLVIRIIYRSQLYLAACR